MNTTLRVALGPRSYDIVVGSGLLDQAGDSLRNIVRQPRVIVVTDAHLAAAGHLDRLAAGLAAARIDHHRLVVPAGEASKSMAELERLLDQLLALGIERSSTIVALGGGVIGDLAGFAAAILLRGIDYVQIPTSLLAQVDSAVGGKTGVNTHHGKNLVGSFHQPRLVLADTGVLATLPPRELRAGYAEVVKYGLIDQPAFFTWLEAHGQDVLAGDAAAQQHAIVTSCTSKAALVAADEREAGARALLNLGHTFAHAFEAIAGYGDRLLHGEAVALGLLLAMRLSARLGLCPEEDVDRLRQHLDAVGLPTSYRSILPEASSHAVIEAMARDKKVEGGRPRFVLVRGIGKAFSGAEVESAALIALLDTSIP